MVKSAKSKKGAKPVKSTKTGVKRAKPTHHSLKKAQFMKLHNKAGGISLKETCYEELRAIAESRMNHIIHNALVHCQNRKAKTINESDMKKSINMSGHHANMAIYYSPSK